MSFYRTAFLSFSSNFKILSFLNLTDFKTKTFPERLFISNKKLKFVSSREFCNDRNRCLVNTMFEVEHPNRALKTLVELSKDLLGCCPEITRSSFNSLLLDVFIKLIYLFRLIGNYNCLNLLLSCLVKNRNTRSLSNFIRNKAESLWMKIYFCDG